MNDTEHATPHAAPPSFSSLGLAGPWLQRLEERGIVTPASIQALGIPAILAGGDIVLRSRTGSGKTLAYLLPALEKIDAESNRLQALVIVPTAELAMQIAKEAESLAEGTKVRCLALIGGASLQRQLDKLKTHPQLVVGTPGRLLEILTLRKLKLADVAYCVLDEADQTFAVGAGGEAERILASLPANVQKVFCSATMADAAAAIVAKRTKNAVWIEADDEDGGRLPDTITHGYVVCEERDRIDTVRRLVRTLQPKAAILFLTRTESVAEVEAKLRYHGLEAAAVYGDQPKQERADVMRRFRSGKLKLLLATDVAARGIDASDVTHVIHVEPPADEERYLHRAGRTGRMGRRGESVLVLSPPQRHLAAKFGKKLGIEIREKQLKGGEWRELSAAAGASSAAPSSGVGAAPAQAKPPARGTSTQAAPVRAATVRGAAERGASVRGASPRDTSARDSAYRGKSERSEPAQGIGARERTAKARSADPAAAASARSKPGGDRPNAKSAAGERASARMAGSERAGAKMPGSERAGARKSGAERPGGKNANRRRDQKDKGAPRWLKAKREGNGGAQDGKSPQD